MNRCLCYTLCHLIFQISYSSLDFHGMIFNIPIKLSTLSFIEYIWNDLHIPIKSFIFYHILISNKIYFISQMLDVRYIYLHLPQTNHPVLQVNIPDMEHLPITIIQLIGLREKLPENPIVHGKIYGFRLSCSLFCQPIELSIDYPQIIHRVSIDILQI